MTFGTTNTGGQPSAPETSAAQEQENAYEQMQQQHDQSGRQQQRTQEHETDDVEDDANAPLTVYFGDDEVQDSPSPGDEDDADQEGDTDTVKRLRGVIRDYKGQLKQRDRNGNSPAAATIPPASEFTENEPQLQDEGIDFDPAKFSEAWKDWNKRKGEHEAGQAKRQARAQELQETLIGKQQAYLTAKTELVKKFPQYEKAEKTAMEHLPDMLQATLLLHSDNPTMLVLAVGSNKKLRDQVLAAQSDPIALGKLIGTIDAKAKLAPRKRKAGESVPEVTSGSDGSTIGNMEALREEARKTGDYTKVNQLRAQRKRAAARRD